MTDPGAPTGPRRFQPTFWSSVCALAGVAVLLGLGTWQLQRLGWKENLIDERVSRSQGPAMEGNPDWSVDITDIMIAFGAQNPRPLWCHQLDVIHSVYPFL